MATGQSFRAFHPLDALTPAEVARTVKVLSNGKLVDRNTLYPMITLHEPDKKTVLSWKKGDPISRRAFVIYRKNSRTFEAVVDLNSGTIISNREKPGAEPSILQQEWNLARDLTFADPAWQAAMRKRGFNPPHAIACSPLSAGFFSMEKHAGRRLLKVPCYSTADRLHPAIGREIEGVVAIVDVNAKKVVDIIDTGQVTRLKPPPAGYGTTTPKPNPPLKPVNLVSPRGTNIKLRGAVEVAWRNWSFHMRADRRAGLILSLVRFDDRGNKRLIAYQMHVSELFVPYMDPDPTWEFKTFMDAGEFGLGYLISSLRPGVDCPANSFFIDLLYPSDFGGMFKAPRAVCIFEKATGAPAWRHWDVASNRTDGRKEIELVVRFIPTVGNYDYVIDYTFRARGDIRVRVGATGFDAVRSVGSRNMDSPQISRDTRYGGLIAPYTVAPYHDHYINFRLDLDIDGQKNNFVRDVFEKVTLPKSAKRRGIWTLKTYTQTSEAPITACSPAAEESVWRLENRNVKTPILKNHPSYALIGHHSPETLLPPNDEAKNRAQFSTSELWMTRYRHNERWAAGMYPNLSQKDSGLPEYTNRESIDNEDIVLWYNLAFRHITRPEDFPILPTMWMGFMLKPAYFFDRDPSSFQNPAFAK